MQLAPELYSAQSQIRYMKKRHGSTPVSDKSLFAFVRLLSRLMVDILQALRAILQTSTTIFVFLQHCELTLDAILKFDADV